MTTSIAIFQIFFLATAIYRHGANLIHHQSWTKNHLDYSINAQYQTTRVNKIVKLRTGPHTFFETITKIAHNHLNFTQIYHFTHPFSALLKHEGKMVERTEK